MVKITFAEFKNAILHKADMIFSKDDFKFSKSKKTFRKSIGKNLVEFSFDFLDYSPDWYEYHFGCSIWIEEIKKIKKEFFEFANIHDEMLWTTVFFEGDFIETLKDKEMKFRSGYYHEVHSLFEIESTWKITNSTLQELAIPLAYSFCTLDFFREYYLLNRQELIGNFANKSLFISILLAAYLKGKDDYYELSNYLENGLDFEKQNGSYYKQNYFFLEKINEFVKR